MQEEYLLSIIIPVYNAENYLEACLDSIVSHILFYKIQVIAVNDGSTDKSAQILQKYKDKYGITIVEQSNAGVSAARNAGIDAAKGKYLTFVDSDDIVLESFWNSIGAWSTSENEMIIYDYIDIDEESKVIQKVNVTKDINDINDVKIHFLSGYLFNTCWGKLYLSKVVKDNHIVFPANMSVGEDMAWMAQLISSIQSIKCVDCIAYGYRQNNNGAMVQLRRTLTKKRIEEFAKEIEIKKQIGQEMSWTGKIRERFYQNYADNSVAKINFAIKYSDNFKDLNKQIGDFLTNNIVEELFINAINSKTINKKRRIICFVLKNRILRKAYLGIKYNLCK